MNVCCECCFFLLRTNSEHASNTKHHEGYRCTPVNFVRGAKFFLPLSLACSVLVESRRGHQTRAQRRMCVCVCVSVVCVLCVCVCVCHVVCVCVCTRVCTTAGRQFGSPLFSFSLSFESGLFVSSSFHSPLFAFIRSVAGGESLVAIPRDTPPPPWYSRVLVVVP